MIVTTAGRTNSEMTHLAKNIANELKVKFIERHKKSIKLLQEETKGDCIVIGKDRFEWHPIHSEEPIFFHPNSSAFRAKRITRGETEPFLQATKLTSSMTFLDCTLGLASDSIIASIITGEKGKVVGIESNFFLSFLVKTGLQQWDTDIEDFNNAMRRITVVNSDHTSFLESLPSNSFDVVYFDPMFELQIEESNGISPLKSIATYSSFHDYIFKEALRVAKERVVLKDHWKSGKFERYGFTVEKRKTAKFHYGVLEKL
ncbi:class I SAM-dependent methyltransferase [Bacillus sp. FJAT-45066]|uniref:class I SAM-dependent methyltransferase n=1 Tax=Bacillus sp. FJAT-45066 TaxID=2011010 RepID=UPI000BB877D7|nr:class I SAM-dependent methyltransferase [Bacillus sp. FJAT-45066]